MTPKVFETVFPFFADFSFHCLTPFSLLYYVHYLSNSYNQRKSFLPLSVSKSIIIILVSNDKIKISQIKMYIHFGLEFVWCHFPYFVNRNLIKMPKTIRYEIFFCIVLQNIYELLGIYWCCYFVFFVAQ